MPQKSSPGEAGARPVSAQRPQPPLARDMFGPITPLDRAELRAWIESGGPMPDAIARHALELIRARGTTLEAVAAAVGCDRRTLGNSIRRTPDPRFNLGGNKRQTLAEWLTGEPAPEPKIVSIAQHRAAYAARAANLRADDFDVLDGHTQVLEPMRSRLALIPFNEITLPTAGRYVIKDVLPREGLVIIYGAPKSCKSFYTFDKVMHVALGWDYRGHRVHQGPVVYCACEGGHGFRARKAAWEQEHLSNYFGPVPFYLVATRLDLKSEHDALGQEIENALGETAPLVIVIV